MYYELVKEYTENIFTLDGIFKSGMVFQRYRKNLIWGHVNSSDFIRATLGGKSLETRLNGDLFEVRLPSHWFHLGNDGSLCCGSRSSPASLPQYASIAGISPQLSPGQIPLLFSLVSRHRASTA